MSIFATANVVRRLSGSRNGYVNQELPILIRPINHSESENVKLDLNTYAINRPFIQDWYRRQNRGNVQEAVSLLSCSTHCPALAMAFYLAEDIGFTPELTEIIGRLIKFYQYTHIVGQPVNSPFLEYEKKS